MPAISRPVFETEAMSRSFYSKISRIGEILSAGSFFRSPFAVLFQRLLSGFTRFGDSVLQTDQHPRDFLVLHFLTEAERIIFRQRVRVDVGAEHAIP